MRVATARFSLTRLVCGPLQLPCWLQKVLKDLVALLLPPAGGALSKLQF